MEDKEFILESARGLERWENTPRPVAADYADMNRDELIKLAIYQRERMDEMESARKESDRKNAELTDKLSALTEQLRKNNEAMSAMANFGVRSRPDAGTCSTASLRKARRRKGKTTKTVRPRIRT